MNLLKRYAVPVACAMTVLTMAACSSTKDERRVPTPLTEFKPVLDVQQAWKASVGKAGRYLFSPVAVGNAVYAAGANGSVAKIDAQDRSGRLARQAARRPLGRRRQRRHADGGRRPEGRRLRARRRTASNCGPPRRRARSFRRRSSATASWWCVRSTVRSSRSTRKPASRSGTIATAQCRSICACRRA